MGYVMGGYPMSGQFTMPKPSQMARVNPFDGVNDWLGGVFGDSYRNTFFGLFVLELEDELQFQWHSVFEQDPMTGGGTGLQPIAPLAAANIQGYSAEDLLQIQKILTSETVLAAETLANVNYEAVYGLTHKQMELAAKISTQRIRLSFMRIQFAAIFFRSETLFQMALRSQLGRIHTELTRLNAIQKAYIAKGFSDARTFLSAVSRIFWVSTVIGNLPNWIQAMNDYAYSLAYEGDAEILLNLVNLAIYSDIIAPGSGNLILAWLL